METAANAGRSLTLVILLFTVWCSSHANATRTGLKAESLQEPGLAVENVAPAPVISGVSPTPGIVHELTSISVTFSQPVRGVSPGDFLLNGLPAQGVSGSGSLYTFFFPQPPFGVVNVSWGPLHTITDLNTRRFDGGGPGSTWAYQLIDPNGPGLLLVHPMPGTTLRRLGEVEVSFTQAVTGVDAADLRLNGMAARHLAGVGAGPYQFSFPEAPPGPITLAWSPDHGILSDEVEPVEFGGQLWGYVVDPGQPAPQVVLNEILAENQTGLADEDGDPEDWIELHNRGSQAVALGGWSLSVDRQEEDQWVFPPVTIPAGGYLLVWASGKDRRAVGVGERLHANFKLNPNGDTLRLFGPERPRGLVDELAYPDQAPNHSYGRTGVGTEPNWKYFAEATPGMRNSDHGITGKVDEVHFSVERGFFNAPFSLTLATRTTGAEIRYTLNGSSPTLTNGFVYLEPIVISTSRVVRAAAFAPNQLPSPVRTHTYLMNLAQNRRLLPVLSLVTDTNHLYGRTGIMESNPRNTTKHGPAWERPVSVEWIRPENNSGFQVDAGLRVAGGDYIRGRYNYRSANPPEGKYSFRLYFRGEYGPGRLNYSVFPETTVSSFNTLHLRAGMNDHTNPLMKDEFVRALSLDVGIAASHGTFVYLFLNGAYKGLYNPTERVDDDFLQAYHGGGKLWDVMGPNNAPIRGDSTAWSQLRTATRKDLTLSTNYLQVAMRMDLTNFVDYLLPLIWADNDDWPHNNTRAAREKAPGAPFRFYPWDAEFAFSGHPVTYDTIANTLSSLSPPWGTTDYQAMFNSLKKSPEFRLLFADRVHRAFYNGGPLTDLRIRARYNAMKARVAPSISGFNDIIGTWISNRHRHVTNSFQKAGFLASSNAPVASQFGGRVPAGYQLRLTNLAGAILYTTDGADPRTAFSATRSGSAREYAAPITVSEPLHLKARSLNGTNWSALIDLEFVTTQLGSPIRITEIMYHPPGGDSFEYIELQNTGGLAVDLSGYSFEGINFRFPTPFPKLEPGAWIVVANNGQPAEFERRYPTLPVAGWFGGSLDNGGERIALIDTTGSVVTSVDYRDRHPWPVTADGGGASLEVMNASGDPDDPANWQASLPGGSPGRSNAAPDRAVVQINELHAGASRDWLELHNPGSESVQLTGWSLTDNADPRQYVFPPETAIAGRGFLRIDCGGDAASGLTAPFRLDRRGETIALYDDQTNRIHALTYGPVIDDFTIGLIDGQLTLCLPTPIGPNQAASIGLLAVKINEFMANPDTGDDWLELHNPGEQPVALQHCLIVTSNAIAAIAAPVFVSAGGFVVLRADEKPGPDHLDLKLPAIGGLIRLLTPQGEELDRVVYSAQSPGLTLGRLPDGTGAFQQLPFSPTPGASNYLADLGTRLRISEFMAWTTSGPDWVEIENGSNEAMELTGYTLGVLAPDTTLIRWPFDNGARLEPGARLLFYFGPVNPAFAAPPNAQIVPTPLNDRSSILTLRDALDRVIDRVEYGLQLPDYSVGRLGQRWELLAHATPGAANGPAATLDFGDGVRLNEWLAASEGPGDFIELYNGSAWPVHLARWVLTDDPSINGSTNNPIAPLTFIAPRGFALFHADGDRNRGPDHTSFKLNRLGETIRLLNATGRIIDTLDLVAQWDRVSEGRYPDGALQILRFPGSMSPAASNRLPSGDADRDGLPDAWELLHGLDPRTASDAQIDLDDDGMSNLAEYFGGTDPRDPSSLLELELLGMESGSWFLRFTAQRGRTYHLEYAGQLTPETWIPFSIVPAGNDARRVTVQDPAGSDLHATRFYRVIIPR